MFEIASPYIIAGATAWIVAQGGKYVVASLRRGKMVSAKQLYLSGSMPSAHSATVVAILVVIGARDGYGSGLFGLALIFASVVLYDAMMVRRSSGEQGAALVALLKAEKSSVKPPRVAKGHTPLEVLVGALLGLAIGLIVASFQIGYPVA